MDDTRSVQVVHHATIWCTFRPRRSKNEKIHTEKNSLYLRKWNVLTLRLKRLLYLLKRKLSLYFQKWNPGLYSPSSKNKKDSPSENFLYFRKRKPRKNFLYFLIFQKTEIRKKIHYISGNRNPRKLLIFQEVSLQAQKMKEKHS